MRVRVQTASRPGSISSCPSMDPGAMGVVRSVYDRLRALVRSAIMPRWTRDEAGRHCGLLSVFVFADSRLIPSTVVLSARE